MPHFVATYTYTEDVAARDAARPSHREYLAGLDELLLSGPTDAGGAVLIFEAGTLAEVEHLLDADPFATAGAVIAQRTVVGWDPVNGRWSGRV